MSKHFDFKAELLVGEGGDGTIEGYASVFGVVDQGGDLVAPGAFEKSLARGEPVRMLWQHDPTRPIGIFDEIEEDAAGLRVKGRIFANVSDGADALALLRGGAINGLSIGYRAVRTTAAAEGVRRIEEADLWEISLVTFPMNRLSTVSSVKAADLSKRELERRLTQDAGLSRSDARALMRDGIKGLSMQDAGDGLEELAGALKRSADAMKTVIGG